MGRGVRGRDNEGNVTNVHISLIGIVTMNSPLYNKYILIKTSTKKSHEEMLNIPGHKGNATQNHVKIPPHSC
jgi:hypothetical protein